VTNIKRVEEFFILTSSIGILCSLMHYLIPKVVVLPNYLVRYSFYAASLFFSVAVVVDLFLIYNVYNFGLKTPMDCLCAQGWQKYYIYLQAITAVIFIALLLYSGISFLTILPIIMASSKNGKLMPTMTKKRRKPKK
jgi:hypothetical protein